jgi:hypothetical protein
MTLLLTKKEMLEVKDNSNLCRNCGENIAQVQLDKIKVFALAEEWGRMVKREDTQVFVPLKAEDIQ